jgi:hypothetical protein
VDESRHPHYRDNEDSRFYKTDRLSPEDTWLVLSDELVRVLMDAQLAFWRGRLDIDPERVRWWHGAIFARHFPHDGGCFRRERAFFGVVTDRGGMRQIEGTAPDALVRADGNHRTAFVALSAALWSLGLPAVEFAEDKDMTGHDSAVAPALISREGDIEPFARLLATQIERARNPAT